jgi:hypothetical protein
MDRIVPMILQGVGLKNKYKKWLKRFFNNFFYDWFFVIYWF